MTNLYLSAQALARKWQRPEYALQRKDLKARGKTISYAVRMGYEPLTAAETKAEIRQDCGPSIAITCFRANGKPRKHRRVRLLDPEKIKRYGRRYTQIENSGVIMHVRTPSKPSKKFKGVTIITEGEFKADAISDALGAKVLSMPGVTCNRKNGKLHPHIATAIGDDEVLIAFDSDQNDKIKEVRKPLVELLDDIKAHGNTVAVGDVPNLPNREKTGWDDYIQHMGVEAAHEIPIHEEDSPKIALWRKTVEPFRKVTGTLPQALRNLKPNGLDWYINEPPPQDPVVAPYLNMGESALIVGQGSVGKNFAVTPFLLAIATGTKFFGYPAAKPRRCMYAMLERSEAMFMRRFHKMAHHLIDGMEEREKAKCLEKIAQNCILKALSGEDISLIEFVNNQWKPAFSIVDELIEQIITARIEVLFLDPMSRLHGGSENDASVAAAFTKALERITHKTGCAIVVIHHTGKDLRGDAYSGRGSSGFNDNMSQTIVMSLVTEAQRKLLKLNDELNADERLYDIVLFSNLRCSDGAKARDMALLRNGETGMFRMINADRKTDEDIFGEIIVKLRPWAKAKEGFTCTAFRDSRAMFSKDISKQEAVDMFNLAIESEMLSPVMTEKDGALIHKKRNGGLVYQLAELLDQPQAHDEKPSRPEVARPTGRMSKYSLTSRKSAKKK